MRLVLAVLVALAPPLALPQSAGKDPAKTQAAKPPPAMPVRAAAARLAPAVDEANAVGTLRADEAVVVRPEIAGRVAEILFEEGQSVAGGAVLVRLDQAELAAVVTSSGAQLKWDRQRLERAEDLFRKGFISQQALDDQRTSLARAQAKLAEDQARLAKTEIRAPFPGIVGLRQVSRGAYVAAGTDIARLEKIDRLKLDFRVPEAFVARLRAGQAVKVAVDAYREQSFGGAIYAIEPAVDEQTRTVLVRAHVGNPELKLRPGMFARVVLQLGVREKAVWVPEQAIVPRGRDSFVFRVANGKADLVKVQTGLRRVGEVEITSGLAAGDLVVTDGTLRLFPGMPVMLMGDKPPAAAAPDKKG
jgi:membrane fusion protein (multidrug efflux system)